MDFLDAVRRLIKVLIFSEFPVEEGESQASYF